MDMIKGIVIGFVLLVLFWLGSCSLIGAGTAVAVGSAVEKIGNEVEQSEVRYAQKEEQEEMDEWNEADDNGSNRIHLEIDHDY